LIAWGLFWVLVALSIRCFWWGLQKPDRLYQFPTLFGAAWLFYMVPQAFGALNNPSKFPPQVLHDGGIELALLMSIICVQAGWLGYHSGAWKRRGLWPSPKRRVYSHRRLFHAAVLLYVVGLYFQYKLAALTGGFVAQFTGGGHYGLVWSGLPVRYVFFGQLIYPGLLFALLSFLHRPSAVRGITVAFFSIYPLLTVIFLGRRSTLVFIILVILLSLYFMRRWTPPRWTAIGGGVFVFVAIVIMPQYRTITQYGIDMEQIREIQVRSEVADVFSGTGYAEFDSFIVRAAAVQQDLTFGLGGSFYNAVVSMLVPRQIVGGDVKEALMIRIGSDEDGLWKRYGWVMPYGSNPTGPANAFTEFWYFGALFYYFAAIIVRRIWEGALQKENHGMQIWYVMISILIPTAVVGSIFILPGRLITLYLFLTPMLIYASRRRRLAYRGLPTPPEQNEKFAEQ